MSETGISVRNIRTRWTLAVLGLLTLCVLLWGPVGVNHVGLVEEWKMYKAHADGYFMFDYPVNRAGQFVLTDLGYHLTPDSFVGLYLIIAAAILVKGLLLFSIMTRLIRNSAPLAFAVAFLWIIYPADTALFYTRTEMYQFISVMYLLAVYTLLRWWDTGHAWYLLPIWVSQILCLITLEVAFPLIFATPILLFWLEKRLSRRVVRYTVIWLIVPVVLAVWTLSLFGNNALFYQSWVVDPSLVSTSSAASIFFSFVYMYLQHFVFGWILALAGPLDVGFKLLAGVVGLLAGILTYLQTRTLLMYHMPHLRRWAYSGLIIMGLGYVTFMASKNHRQLMDRVFLLSSAGAALTLMVVVWSLVNYFPAARRRAAFSSAVGLLAAWAGLWAYQRQQQSIKYSDLETKILSGIVQQAPAWSAEHPVVALFDRTGRLATGDIIATFGTMAILDSAEMKFGGNQTSRHFQDAVRYIYNSDKVDAVLCFPDTVPQRLKLEQCDLQADHFLFRSQSTPGGAYPYDQVIAFEYTGENITLLPSLALSNGQVIANYRPDRIIKTSAPFPPRYFTLFFQIDTLMSSEP